jgi:hypothetical protein
MFDLFARMEEDFALLDRRAVFALVYTAIGLTGIYYLKTIGYLDAMATAVGLGQAAEAIERSNENNLLLLSYWVGVSLTLYFVIPAIILKLVFKQRLADYGLSLSIEKGFLKLLLQSLALMLPIVSLMSLTPGFLA